MAKKAQKREAKPARHPVHAPQKRKYDKHVVIIGILVLIIALTAYFTLNKAPAKDVLAMVNGQEVTQKDVDLVAKFLADDQRMQSTQEMLLNRTIDEELLLQEAVKKGVSASDSEVQSAYQEAIKASGRTQQDVEKYLADRNITHADSTAFFKKQVIFLKLIGETKELQVTATEAEMQAFYEQNQAQIGAPYDSIKPQIKKAIENSKLSQAFADYLKNLRAKADIKIIKQ